MSAEFLRRRCREPSGGSDEGQDRRSAPGSEGGGAATVNQYLAAGAIDELRLHVVPLILGAGERLFEGVTDVELEPISVRETELVTHLTYRVRR